MPTCPPADGLLFPLPPRPPPRKGTAIRLFAQNSAVCDLRESETLVEKSVEKALNRNCELGKGEKKRDAR